MVSVRLLWKGLFRLSWRREIGNCEDLLRDSGGSATSWSEFQADDIVERISGCEGRCSKIDLCVLLRAGYLQNWGISCVESRSTELLEHDRVKDDQLLKQS